MGVSTFATVVSFSLIAFTPSSLYLALAESLTLSKDSSSIEKVFDCKIQVAESTQKNSILELEHARERCKSIMDVKVKESESTLDVKLNAVNIALDTKSWRK